MDTAHRSQGSLLGAAFLVAGTSIGGGMLALPVLTSLGGFIPSLAIFLACWLFMASTGLLMLEVCLWMPGDTNLVSMAERTLGFPGKVAAWGLYIFLFYTLTIAYISGIGDVLGVVVTDAIPEAALMVTATLFSAVAVYIGARIIDRINLGLMIGLGITYALFVWWGLPHVNTDYLHQQNWPLSLVALPVAFTSFAYQGIVPTITRYLGRDTQRIRKAILLGSFLAFVAYGVWEALIHGIIPAQGPNGLVEALQNNRTAVHPLQVFTENAAVAAAGHYFAFFAVATSLLGVTLGLRDFLADGLQVEKDRSGKLLLCSIIFVPPAIIALASPRLFTAALGIAGGFGCALLLGLMPILMVWAGRYHLNIKGDVLLPGGRKLLVVLALFIGVELVCEIAHLLR